MYCIRLPNVFYTPNPNADPSPRKRAEDMTDTEIRNKICEERWGKRGKCRECPAEDMCKYGQEAIKRGLV